MKHVEVEVKYSLPDPASLIERLAELEAVPLGEDRQVDTYFNAPHRDFLAGEIVSEWLRLRAETGDHSADRTSINFKRWLPLGAAEATHCDEFESGITDSEAVRKLLDALGFTEMITVDKLRRQWRLGDVIVAMDIVAGLGSFMEVEYAGNAQSVDEAARAVEASVSEIDVKLGDRDRRGYPYLLLNRQQ
jgi:adenylate cyclase class 2